MLRFDFAVQQASGDRDDDTTNTVPPCGFKYTKQCRKGAGDRQRIRCARLQDRKVIDDFWITQSNEFGKLERGHVEMMEAQ